MSEDELSERKHHLLDLLEIAPYETRLVRELSGGQQRRVCCVCVHMSTAHCVQVSLAVALLHKPQLLILDEPTVWRWPCASACDAVQVGVDALLRAKLWEYLLRLVKVEDVTILITTHYIEEARQVSAVGATWTSDACAGGHCGADAGRASACGECAGCTDGTVQQSDAGGCVP